MAFLRIFTFAVLSVIAVSAGVVPQDKPGFYHIGAVGGKNYYAAKFSLQLDFLAALDHCHASEMRLLSLNNAEELAFVGQFIVDTVAQGGHVIVPESGLQAEEVQVLGGGGGGDPVYFKNVWISATKDENTESWSWNETGEPLAYANWGAGYPKAGTQANCAYILYYGLEWYNLECKYSQSIICEV